MSDSKNVKIERRKIKNVIQLLAVAKNAHVPYAADQIEMANGAIENMRNNITVAISMLFDYVGDTDFGITLDMMASSKRAGRFLNDLADEL